MTDLWVDLQLPSHTEEKPALLRIPHPDAKGNQVGASSMTQLIVLVDKEITSLTEQGFKYKPQLTEQAQNAKLSYKAFLGLIIENMMCMRRPELCYSDGIGDILHKGASAIDNAAEYLPGPLSRGAKAAIEKAVAFATNKPAYQGNASSCQICGGTRSISVQQDNLGRAGALNNLTK